MQAPMGFLSCLASACSVRSERTLRHVSICSLVGSSNYTRRRPRTCVILGICIKLSEKWRGGLLCIRRRLYTHSYLYRFWYICSPGLFICSLGSFVEEFLTTDIEPPCAFQLLLKPANSSPDYLTCCTRVLQNDLHTRNRGTVVV